MCFADLCRGMNGFIQKQQYAFASCLIGSGSFYRAVNVGRTVRTCIAGSAHCGGENNRFLTLMQQIKHVGGFFDCVGAVCDNSARDSVFFQRFFNHCGKIEHFLRSHCAGSVV